MKISALLLPLVLAGVQAQTARQQYGATCPSKNDQIEEILPGYTVKYACGARKGGTTRRNVASLRDCARLCQDEEGCTGSSWSASRICVLGGVGTLQEQSNVVFMERIEEPDPLEDNPFDGPEQCETELTECQETLQDLDSQLGTCTSQQTVDTAQIQCNQDNGQTTRIRGKNWKIHCGKEAECLGSTHNIGTRDNLRQCVEACGDRPSCKFVSFGVVNKSCWVASADKQWNSCNIGTDARFHTVQFIQ